MTQKKYNSDNCIVLMIINFFIVIMIIGGLVSGVANPKLWGSKCLTLGKQRHLFETPFLVEPGGHPERTYRISCSIKIHN